VTIGAKMRPTGRGAFGSGFGPVSLTGGFSPLVGGAST
jgi:hypothetical protein